MFSIIWKAPLVFTLAIGTDQAPNEPFSPIWDPEADVSLTFLIEVLSWAMSLAILPLSVIEILVVVIAAAHSMPLIRLPKPVILILLELCALWGGFSLKASINAITLFYISALLVLQLKVRRLFIIWAILEETSFLAWQWLFHIVIEYFPLILIVVRIDYPLFKLVTPGNISGLHAPGFPHVGRGCCPLIKVSILWRWIRSEVPVHPSASSSLVGVAH